MLFGKRDRTIRRLLLVEDEPLVAFDNEHFLVEAGYTVVATVDSVADAMAVLRREPVDLVLTDIKLSGGGNGLDVARAATTQGIPVLIVTGTPPLDVGDLAVACLAKPHSHRSLRAAIEAVEGRLQGAKRKRVPAGLTLYGADA
ncbi:hypothetical protein ACFB49_10600 [Sphingomonas sp. DBB INV C78]|uniref:response regulator n=1 Tax=Sphingomonas sp. DBB INV C78 TaxID=3349434 RepID=UPI0036D31976